MTLSACMIVKNEAENLMKCLKSIRPHVDEIVIVDTGSTDGTREMAEKYADVFDEIEWKNDFSAARNHSMDLATGDVILIIDADEYVTFGWPYVQMAINHKGFLCGLMGVLNLTTQGPVRGERIFQMRLFKNVPELRYTYAIHNQIEDSVHAYAKSVFMETGEKPAVIRIESEIVHTGYDFKDGEDVIRKYTPRLAILREEIRKAAEMENDRDKAYYEFQLALMLNMVFSKEDSLPYWEGLDYSKLNQINRWYAHYVAARVYLAMQDYDEALRHCDGMFQSEFDDSTGATIAPEAASWVISGVVMCNLADTEEEKNKGLIYLVEGFLRNLQPSQGMRCIMDSRQLIRDIAFMADRPIIAASDDLKEAVGKIRELQMDLHEFDESLMEGIA